LNNLLQSSNWGSF